MAKLPRLFLAKRWLASFSSLSFSSSCRTSSGKWEAFKCYIVFIYVSKEICTLLTLVDTLDILNLQEHGQRDLVDLVRWADLSLASTEAHLVVGALGAEALVQTHVDRGTELHVRRVGELEGLELGTQNVAINGVEVLEEIGIHCAAKIQKVKNFIECSMYCHVQHTPWRSTFPMTYAYPSHPNSWHPDHKQVQSPHPDWFPLSKVCPFIAKFNQINRIFNIKIIWVWFTHRLDSQIPGELLTILANANWESWLRGPLGQRCGDLQIPASKPIQYSVYSVLPIRGLNDRRGRTPPIRL